MLNATLSNGRHKLAIMSSSSATNPRSEELLETREDAVHAVQRILAGNESRFEMVFFQKYNPVSKLRSQHYNGYFVICHIKPLTFDRMDLVPLCIESWMSSWKNACIGLGSFKEEHPGLKDIHRSIGVALLY